MPGAVVIVVHPAFQWRMDLYELCLLVGIHGYVLSNRRGKSGRSWLVLTRAEVSL